jgi:hypothetical protein
MSKDNFSYKRMCIVFRQSDVQVLPKAGYFMTFSPEWKLNRITEAEKTLIDAAKQVKPG